MRLINADALKEKLRADTTKMIVYSINSCIAMNKMIDEAPTIEAEPVRHGEWKEHGNFIQCSQCGEDYAKYDWHGSVVSYYYCPNCGAQMHEKAP